MVLTTRCNLKCEDYCPMFKVNGERPVYDECSVDEWKTFIENYPNHIEEVFLSGGETSLYPNVSELVNWMVSKGIYVCIFSNLWKPEAFLGLKKSYRLVLYPTYHVLDSPVRFDHAYRMLKDRITVIPIEFSNPPVLPYTKFKDTYPLKYFLDEMRLHFSPTTPRTKRTYTATLPMYADGTGIGACNVIQSAIKRDDEYKKNHPKISSGVILDHDSEDAQKILGDDK